MSKPLGLSVLADAIVNEDTVYVCGSDDVARSLLGDLKVAATLVASGTVKYRPRDWICSEQGYREWVEFWEAGGYAVTTQ